jgi:hypothetical protein
VNPFLVRGITLVVLGAMSAGCAAQPQPVDTAPGFLAGLLHGIVGPVALVVSFFRSDVRLYAFPNTGVLYDLGFLLGLSAWGGGAGVGWREYEKVSRRLHAARARIRRLRRTIRRLRVENWRLRNRGT